MNESERVFAIQYLEQTRERLLAFAASLPPERRNFRRTREEWSAAGLIEHIIVVETWSLGQIEGARPDESRRGKGGHKDKLILESVPLRDRKAPAPETSYPEGRWPEWDEMIRQFNGVRDRVIEYARSNDSDMRIHFASHPFFKDLDRYQWLILIASHTERHVRQAEEMLQ